jgi:glycosyltransferase involved in cell wall biosynthesis
LVKFEDFLNEYQRERVSHFSDSNIDNPFISVCVITYNHKEFISRCLDSILEQQTRFEFEILIGEDASSDGTREICIEYAKKYPDKIRLFLHSRQNNICIDGEATGRFNFTYSLFSSRGKYIALCDGDDFWTDPLKLQKQVDFLENAPEYSFCYHQSDWIDDEGSFLQSRDVDNGHESTMDIGKAILSGGGSFATASLVFRSAFIRELPEWFLKFRSGDTSLLFLLALHGRGKFMPFRGSCYRIHSGGLNSSVQNNVTKKVEWQKDDINLLNAFNDYTSGRYLSTIQKAKYKHIVKMLRLLNLNLFDSLQLALKYNREISFGLTIQLLFRVFARKYN